MFFYIIIFVHNWRVFPKPVTIIDRFPIIITNISTDKVEPQIAGLQLTTSLKSMWSQMSAQNTTKCSYDLYIYSYTVSELSGGYLYDGCLYKATNVMQWTPKYS